MSSERPVAPPADSDTAISSSSTAPMATTTLASAAGLPATSTDLAESTTANLNTSPPLLDGMQAMSPVSATSIGTSEAEAREDPNADVDPQIMEALKSKDRIFVLRVGELMESLINERKPRIELTPATSYQRLLVHRCSAYYKVSPESDAVTKAIIVHSTIESRIPARRIAELVPAESTKQPAFQIMRRTPGDRIRSKPTSRTGSVGGDDVEYSDGEPSEGGSNGSRKKHLTIEEREAAYNEARSRIFMNFEEKAKEKENDMSASSSTFSLVSGSASTSGGGSSSAGDIDDSISTAATESEWSGPVTRDKRDIRRNGSGANSARSSSRSLRSVHASSSRNSRAPSPSFTYASLYEPPPTLPYDPSQGPGQAAQGYMSYMYTYPPPGQPQQPGFMAPYPYYPYPYAPHMANSDPGSPTGEGLYVQGHGQHPQQVPYMQAQYMWPPAPGVPQGAHSAGPSPAPGGPYPQYGPTSAYGPYTMPGYYPPPLNPHAQPHVPPMPGQGQALYPAEPQHQLNGNGGALSNGEGTGSPFRRPQARSSTNGSSSSIGSQGRRQSSGAKGAWSYGPGVSLGGYQIPGMSTIGGIPNTMGPGAGENPSAVGPRLSNSRRTSGNSNGSGAKTPGGDEASSVASSTSSSSRRTYTSTTSSQHPLPARPDWAVGLKAQPTLHATHPHPRNHDHSNSHSRTMSPAQNAARLPHGTVSAPVVLQSADFPPLTSLTSTPEKRAPVPNGAWNKPANRSFLTSSPGQQASYSNVLAQPNSSGTNGHPINANLGASVSRLDEPDKAFERPPPKGNVALFNPKDNLQQETLVEKMEGMAVGGDREEGVAAPDGGSNGRP